MSQYFEIHPDTPQARLIKQAAQIVRQGGLIALPTDSSYALACQLDDKAAVERLRRLREIDDRHHLTLMCSDLSELGNFARVDNRQYRWIKGATPGPYVFILEATKEVPRRLSHPARKTIGVRVPEHAVALALLGELGQPLISATLQMPGDEAPMNDPSEIRARLEKRLDLVIDGGPAPAQPTTVIDLTSGEPELIRVGRGDIERFGLNAAAA
ncbi:MAG: threonylcarbamoyl-AMP synthase [Cupriavidus sp.]|jgi:tRNA threonylcarbamoyl adenosine modification protein (Sua5/YciO/YrdC/YwlC family)|uniref:L-threonylcarbamoyladenylate synthase n=1 Tax=Cupriavidus pauculus TaxID=82633 RepID=UPI000782C5EC|nr:L-threonylcarbamoyladenylate synthase [Cupriavidus pauculus]MBU69981.1 threonylcarbamoyl-AMP synthase [Cupriavidus sp.]KAB0601186.1 threonylcarbamoyl-AMP synthase [Cupriavidus pauculus]MBY4729614.1 threonylcarbamoyl-AMP synthase [Cupriavidus pauculus]MCM3606831.1 L-threonylcarbamoyladenylate synthase [Cupriavidus pauculus]UAK99141.1 threonylcarbamoyl-AMP synthase [Cupriavidus pauculus]